MEQSATRSDFFKVRANI